MERMRLEILESTGGWTNHPSWHDEYPFKSHYLETDGYRYHFIDEGEGDPVLMVHGNPTWSFYWRRLVLALSPQQRAIAVDHLGCGLSDKPLDYPYRLEDHVANPGWPDPDASTWKISPW